MSSPADLQQILKGVSRSFYLSLRILPKNMRKTAALAYLLARAADTVSDTDILTREKRQEGLQILRHSFDAKISASSLDSLSRDLGTQSHAHTDEVALMNELPAILELYRGLSPARRGLTQKVLMTLTDGMLFDLQHFDANPAQPKSLATKADTELYAYQVAGCVGEFWTDLLILETLPHRSREPMVSLGVKFGKGLQMINILRDLPKDLMRGRCYLSEEALDHAGLRVDELPTLLRGDGSTREQREAFQALYQEQIALARSWLASGLAYTFLLPRRAVRLRLAVLWPLLIGLATLQLLERRIATRSFTQGIRISRSQVYRILTTTGLAAWSNSCLDRLYRDQGGLPV